MPEMMEQLERVPKMVSQRGLQRRTVEQIVVFLRNLQRTIEHDLDDIDKNYPLRSGFLAEWADRSYRSTLRQESVEVVEKTIRSRYLSGCVNRAELPKFPRSRARMSR